MSNNVSILGREYSNVPMLCCNETEKIRQDNLVRDYEVSEFKNEFDITFNQKYNKANNITLFDSKYFRLELNKISISLHP